LRGGNPFLRRNVPTIAASDSRNSNLARFQDSFANLNMSTQTVLGGTRWILTNPCDFRSQARSTLASFGINTQIKLNRTAFVYGIGEESTALKAAVTHQLGVADCSQESITKLWRKASASVEAVAQIARIHW